MPGPQGATGATGATGPVGATGPQGPTPLAQAVAGPWSYYTGLNLGGIQDAATSYGGTTLESSNYGLVAPFSGSIIGVMARVQQSANATFTAYYQINGVRTAIPTVTAAANTITTCKQTFARGAVPFAAGAVLGLACQFSAAAASGKFVGHLVLQFDATF